MDGASIRGIYNFHVLSKLWRLYAIPVEGCSPSVRPSTWPGRCEARKGTSLPTTPGGKLDRDPPLGGGLSPSENLRTAAAFHNGCPQPPLLFSVWWGWWCGCLQNQSWKTFNFVDVIPLFPMLPPLATTTQYLELRSCNTS